MVQKPKGQNHLIINRFLNTERAKLDKYFWPREMKLAVGLVKKYPFDFLIQLQEPFITKLGSLAWFLTDDGEKFLFAQFFEYKKKITNLEKIKEEIVLTPNKIGEDIQIKRQPTTLLEFIKNYG